MRTPWDKKGQCSGSTITSYRTRSTSRIHHCMVTLGDTHQHRLRPAVVVVHLREQQHDVGSPKRCRRPLSRFCISAHKLKCCAEPARPTSSSLRLAAVAQAPVHLCNGDCPPLPRVARDITDSARCRSNVGLGGAITNEIDWPGQILKGHEAARNGPPSASTTPGAALRQALPPAARSPARCAVQRCCATPPVHGAVL